MKTATLLACGLLLAGCATATVEHVARGRCWVGEVVRAEAVRVTPDCYRLLLDYDDGVARVLLFDREPYGEPGVQAAAEWQVRQLALEQVAGRRLRGGWVEALVTGEVGVHLTEGFVVSPWGWVSLYVGGERAATAEASRLRQVRSVLRESVVVLLPLAFAFDVVSYPLQVVGWPLWLPLWLWLGIADLP